MKRTKKKTRGKFNLTILYTLLVFCVLLASLLVAGGISYLMSRLGVLVGFISPEDGTLSLVIFMALVSLVVGTGLTLVTSRGPLHPFHSIINQLNRLARGDFSARLTFDKPLRNNPGFREVADSFNKMAQELESTEMLRSDFVNNFSHEFKTPIVSIAGFAKLLRRGNLTEEEKQEYLRIIEEESLRLAAMTTNVMELTRIENQSILTNVTQFNLSEQLRSCVLLLEDKWSRRNLTLDLEFEEYTILANEELLRQVWINLLDNAIKFSPPTAEIRVRISQTDIQTQVDITNYGSDIPPDKLGKIWAKFYQADESHASQGNGIGLAVVRRVAELHGGSVQARSGGGVTTFTVILPRTRA